MSEPEPAHGPGPDPLPPRRGSQAEVAAWVAGSVVLLCVLLAYVSYLVHAVARRDKDDALSFFFAVLAFPGIVLALRWTVRQALHASRRPAPPAPPVIDELRTHASFADDADPPPTRW